MGMRMLLRRYRGQRGAWLGCGVETEKESRSGWGGTQIMESRECLGVKAVPRLTGKGAIVRL